MEARNEPTCSTQIRIDDSLIRRGAVPRRVWSTLRKTLRNSVERRLEVTEKQNHVSIPRTGYALFVAVILSRGQSGRHYRRTSPYQPNDQLAPASGTFFERPPGCENTGMVCRQTLLYRRVREVLARHTTRMRPRPQKKILANG